jgi:hypothetical protein
VSTQKRIEYNLKTAWRWLQQDWHEMRRLRKNAAFALAAMGEWVRGRRIVNNGVGVPLCAHLPPLFL